MRLSFSNTHRLTWPSTQPWPVESPTRMTLLTRTQAWQFLFCHCFISFHLVFAFLESFDHDLPLVYPRQLLPHVFVLPAQITITRILRLRILLYIAFQQATKRIFGRSQIVVMFSIVLLAYLTQGPKNKA